MAVKTLSVCDRAPCAAEGVTHHGYHFCHECGLLRHGPVTQVRPTRKHEYRGPDHSGKREARELAEYPCEYWHRHGIEVTCTIETLTRGNQRFHCVRSNLVEQLGVGR